MAIGATAQPAMRTVGIFLFNDIEVLDFAGPWEVFTATSRLNGNKLLDTFTVGELPGFVFARNGLCVRPHYSFLTCPKIDILVVPGGYGTRALIRNEDVLNWIRGQAQAAEVVLSVCTGALLLGKAGLLDGKLATTHHSALELLAQVAPEAKVMRSRRVTDNGKIITSAGVAAGIDASLHLVERLFGKEQAERTAGYMEYVPAKNTDFSVNLKKHRGLRRRKRHPVR